MVKDPSHWTQPFWGLLEPSVTQAFTLATVLGPPVALCSAGALRAVDAAGKWSKPQGSTRLEGDQGSNHFTCQYKYALAEGPLVFFTGASQERPVLLFYRWADRLLEVKKLVSGHTGSPYQRHK